MKRTYVYLLAAVCALFCACEPDPKNEPNAGNGGNTNQTTDAREAYVGEYVVSVAGYDITIELSNGTTIPLEKLGMSDQLGLTEQSLILSLDTLSGDKGGLEVGGEFKADGAVMLYDGGILLLAYEEMFSQYPYTVDVAFEHGAAHWNEEGNLAWRTEVLVSVESSISSLPGGEGTGTIDYVAKKVK